MSSTSSAALVASALGSSAPACEPRPSARSTVSAAGCSPSTGPLSPATMTSALLQPLGCEQMAFELTPSAAGFPANHSAQRLEDDGSRSIYGPKCSASSETFSPGSSSPKTLTRRRSPTRLNVSVELATERVTAVYRQMIAGQTIKEIVGGQLHTPTRKANFTAPSMQKWPSCRRFVAAFGGREITPEQFEFLMGLPIGWTELEPSATPSCRKSRKRSGEPS